MKWRWFTYVQNLNYFAPKLPKYSPLRITSLLSILLALLFCSFVATAQHPYYYTLNDDNGLPSNEVYDLQQDQFGYMWIGCDAGLYRYDGFKFQRYKNTYQNAVAISGLRLSEDKKMFCQNFFGQLFYAEDDSMVLFADVKEQVKSHPEYTIDKERNVLIGLPNGILLYRADGSKELLFKNNLSVNEIEVTDNGDVYVLDLVRGLFRITKNRRGDYALTQLKTDKKVFRNSGYAFRKFGNSLFILSTRNNSNNDHFIAEVVGDSTRIIRTIQAGSIAEFVYTIALIEGKLWLCTSNGVYTLGLDGEYENRYFPGEKISDIFVDREGAYWFSSLQNGVFVIPQLSLMLLNTNNSALKDNNITALKNNQTEGVFSGTYTGDIYLFSPNNNRLELFPKSNNYLYRNVTSIIPLNDHTLLAGRGGISVINTKTKTENSYSSVYVRDMAMVHDSLICVSTQSISAVSKVSSLVKDKLYQPVILKDISGKKVCYDRAGSKLWVTLNEGLATLEGGDFKLFKIAGKPVFCNALYADTTGLWAGTVSDGVYNIRNGKVSLHLNNNNGLIGNNIKCMTSRNDTLYVATDECVNIRFPDGSFSYINNANGINAKEINAISISNQYIYIGTIRGLFYTPVSKYFTNNVKPNIRLSSVYVDGQKCDVTKKVWLNYYNKDILINFSATALKSRGRFLYKYRIAGFQNEWKLQEGNINNVRLSHLPAGSYTFEVMALNENGIASKDVAKISLEVATPFWQHWLFYLLLVVVASSMVTLLFLLRIRTIKRKADIREQITNSQLTALKAQMNPHFMYNTLNSIQDLILQNDIKNTNYYLSRYSSLMRKILDNSDDKEIELAEETEILKLYLELEQLRFGKEFTFSITISAEINKNEVQIPTMIIQPFVENAIKHGLLHKKGEKTLEIIFLKEGNNLKCIIRDNGIGRKKANEIKQRSPIHHKSFATRATEKRLELININRKNKIKLIIDDIYTEDKSAGTEVILVIPLS